MLRSKYLSILLLLFLLYYMISCISRTGREAVSAPAPASNSEPPVLKTAESPAEFESAREQWQYVKNRYEGLPLNLLENGGASQQVAIHTVSYTLSEVDNFLKEREKKKATVPAVLPGAGKHLDLAQELVESLAARQDPFFGRSGDMRLAYRSEVDASLQPFRLYVPPGLSVGEPSPMIVALHGRSGDENTFLDTFRDRRDGTSVFTRLGDQYGFILVSPRGGGPGSAYRDAAAQDVLDVTALIPQLYRIRKDAIFLTGHSMGGGGTMLIGLRNAEHYRALAPIAGGLWVAGSISDLSAKAKEMPVRYYHGTADDVVLVEQRALASTEAVLADFEVIKFRGEDHSSIFYRALPEVFKFFDSFL